MVERLPEHDPQVKRRPRAAWKPADDRTALGRLRDLAAERERTHPGAAASLREGWRKTLTLPASASTAVSGGCCLDQPLRVADRVHPVHAKVKLNGHEMAHLDEMRGSMTRAAFLRRLLHGPPSQGGPHARRGDPDPLRPRTAASAPPWGWRKL